MSAEDLGRVRITETVDQEVEAVLALEAWRAGGEFFRPWQKAVRGRLARQPVLAERLGRLSGASGAFRDVLRTWANGRIVPSGRSVRMALSHTELTETVREFHRLAVMPCWADVRDGLEAERDNCRQIIGSRGVDALLGTLHPQIRWSTQVLEVPAEQDIELSLDGLGLRLAPSLFLQRAGVLLRSRRDEPDEAPTLFFAMRPDRIGAPALAGAPEVTVPAACGGQKPLVALVGRTRAAVLQEVLEGCTTGELADRIGVSASAVSQHTTVLRAAGLIDTRRSGNGVLHTVTPLGRLLLRGETRPGGMGRCPSGAAPRRPEGRRRALR
ncbi:ArsR/SmtB family transcription factor [Kitasatospora sp. NPDC101157]|uniref:ArsR/SmtB family transcription factor n=1 Tax=Kitasatospora sp. NPDC101157 TaxID=3364098 RepID=UPI003820E601